MRALITSTPGAGHVLPLAPVARALQARGHSVLWASGADAQQLIARAGLEATPAGLDQPTRMRRFRDSRDDIGTLAPRERRAVTFPALFADLSAKPMYDDLARIADAFHPDVIVHDPSELAAAPLAARRSIPHVVVGFGRLVPPVLLTASRRLLGELWQRAGAAEVPADCGTYEHLYLHPLPASFEPVPPDLPIRRFRPGDERDDAALEDGLDERGEPSLYVTFGTEFASAAPWPAVLDALRSSGFGARCTVGPAFDPAALGAPPPGVTIERWYPQRRAMTEATAVVSHGGSGAVLDAAMTGRPHLALPIGADHFDNADLLRARGMGVSLEPEEVTAERVATALRRLLDDHGIRVRARQAAAELAALPSVDHAVQDILDLV